MRIAIAQINPIVGDLQHNSATMLDVCNKAKKSNADLVIYPELSLTGYPPKDLLLRHDFLEGQIAALAKLSRLLPLPAIVGAAVAEAPDRAPFNAAVFCENGEWKIIAKKILLPNYNIFDEKRYFETPEDTACSVFTFKGKRFVVSICEDAWGNELIEGQRKYHFDPIRNAIEKHGPVDAIINVSASPFTISKPQTRTDIFTTLAKTHRVKVFVVGQVGGNDQLLFDGQSMVIDKHGAITDIVPQCTEGVVVHDLDSDCTLSKPKALMEPAELLLEIITMGVRDYVEKCRIKGVVIGVSGGVDSAVCLALAVRALGNHRVRAVFLPSQFTSTQSKTDAQNLCKNMKVTLEEFPIESPVGAFRELLRQEVAQASAYQSDICDQNLQARTRGLLIMALTNLSDYIMITTSNKSELAMGYSTIYGDMCGAFSPIGDLYKTQVWHLAHTINRQQQIIPPSIITRPPTAELKHNQLDTDSLPEFILLDKILFNYIELEKSASEIETITSSSRALIDDVIKKIALAEYKRRQGPFPLMVSNKVFGEARRLPIAKNISYLDP